ncbi:PEP-CTERM sorting domain-containing protein [Methylobacillus sp.]|uniref:PEP-CTERM sorting domain-containing protein n=1 Tax=Methylobacillus sp. TaxID=56818 RepID=UPI002FE19E2B
MTFSYKLAAIALAASATFATSASATTNVWDSATPWGDATPVQYVEWNSFDTVAGDSTPEIGAGTISLTPPAAIQMGEGIYTLFNIPTFTATLAGTAGVFDVYLRTAAQGNTLDTTATLNGTSATAVVAFSGVGSQGDEQELYWVWNNVAGADLYTFQFKAASEHIFIDQIALATVAAVPEPSTYAMLALGLGMLGAASRRTRKQN